MEQNEDSAGRGKTRKEIRKEIRKGEK